MKTIVFVLCKETPDMGKEIVKVVSDMEKAVKWVDNAAARFRRNPPKNQAGWGNVPKTLPKEDFEKIDRIVTKKGSDMEYSIYYLNDSYGWYCYPKTLELPNK